MLSTRNVLPLSVLSLTKSSDHVVFGISGSSKGFLTLTGSLLFNLTRLLKWSFRYTRYTFLWFHVWPALRILWYILSNPSPYSAVRRIMADELLVQSYSRLRTNKKNRKR